MAWGTLAQIAAVFLAVRALVYVFLAITDYSGLRCSLYLLFDGQLGAPPPLQPAKDRGVADALPLGEHCTVLDAVHVEEALRLLPRRADKVPRLGRGLERAAPQRRLGRRRRWGLRGRRGERRWRRCGWGKGIRVQIGRDANGEDANPEGQQMRRAAIRVHHPCARSTAKGPQGRATDCSFGGEAALAARDVRLQCYYKSAQ